MLWHHIDKRRSGCWEIIGVLYGSSVIRPQDVLPWYIYLLRNRYTRTVAWQWLRDNWSWVIETFGGDKSYDEFPRYTASGLMTQSQLDEYIEFFGPMKSEPALKRNITLGISEIRARLELLESDGDDVRAKLESI